MKNLYKSVQHPCKYPSAAFIGFFSKIPVSMVSLSYECWKIEAYGICNLYTRLDSYQNEMTKCDRRNFILWFNSIKTILTVLWYWSSLIWKSFYAEKRCQVVSGEIPMVVSTQLDGKTINNSDDVFNSKIWTKVMVIAMSWFIFTVNFVYYCCKVQHSAAWGLRRNHGVGEVITQLDFSI